MTRIRYRIKLADPFVGDAEVLAVGAVLRSGSLTKGAQAEAFERALAAAVERRYATLVNSGTSALLAAAHALGIGPSKRVLVPAFTFPAPALAARALGATVLLADVDPLTFNISWETLRAALDERVDLVIAVDQFGLPCVTPQLTAALARRRIPLLVDAACSLGSSVDGRPAGAAGVAAIFSFHPRKVVTTGEGGAVVTDDARLHRAVRRFSNQGQSRGRFAGIGLNLRMDEMRAAAGRAQLSKLPEMLAKRARLAARYRRRLALACQQIPAGCVSNHQSFVALMPRPFDGTMWPDFTAFMAARGIEVGRAGHCLAEIPALKGIDARVPVATDIARRGIALPLYPALDEGSVDDVVFSVHDWLMEKRMMP